MQPLSDSSSALPDVEMGTIERSSNKAATSPSSPTMKPKTPRPASSTPLTYRVDPHSDDEHSDEEGTAEKPGSPSADSAGPPSLQRTDSDLRSEKLHGFFSHEVKDLRKELLKKLIGLAVVLCIVFGLYLIILFGSQWDTFKFWHNLDVAIVNADQGPFAAQITAAFFLGIPGRPSNFDWTYENSLSYSEAVEKVKEGHFYMALYFPPTFSSNVLNSLNDSINTGSFKYSNPIQYVLDEGRQSAVAATLRSVTTNLLNAANVRMGTQVLSQALSQNVSISSLADRASFNSPFTFQEVNLHPVVKPGMNLATGFIFTMLLVYSIMFANAIPDITKLGFDKLWTSHVLWLRLNAAIWLPAILALVPGWVLLAYANNGADTNTICESYGGYWALIWLTIMVFTSICVTLHYMGPLGQLLLPIFLVLNISSSDILVPIDLAPSFFQIGYAFPMLHAVMASRTVVFCSYNRIGMNVGVLIAWFVFSKLVLAAIARRHDIFQQSRKEKKYRRARRAQKKAQRQSSVGSERQTQSS